MPGQYIKTGDWETYYELIGSPDREVLVFIHGYVSYSFIWEHNYYEFAAPGHRVLRYDLLGRGFSDKPTIAYTPELFRGQLRELLLHLDIEEPIILIALSMGGIIAADYMATYPEHIKGVCFISPAIGNSGNSVMGLLNVPVIGEYLIYSFGNGIISEGYKKSFVDPEQYLRTKEVFEFPIPYRGYKYALLSTFRNLFTGDLTDIYSRAATMNINTILIWGEKDQAVPFENSTLFKKVYPKATLYPLKESGHLSPYENADQVNRIISAFIE